jgi:hypothetical protein
VIGVSEELLVQAGAASETDARVDEAFALVEQAAALRELSEFVAARGVIDDLLVRYGESSDEEVLYYVAAGMWQQALVYRALELSEQESGVLAQLCDRFAATPNPTLSTIVGIPQL